MQISHLLLLLLIYIGENSNELSSHIFLDFMIFFLNTK
jgi:hypothetical protein